MRRREFLRATAAILSAAPCAILGAADPSLELGPGPYPLLDDHLLELTPNVTRVGEQPERLERPVLDSATFGTTQPYLGIMRSAEGTFRIWYNHGPSIWHADSDDGVQWRNPREVWKQARGYGCSVVVAGPSGEPPERRFKLAHWSATRELEDTPRDDAGIYVGFSPDGLSWTRGQPGPVLPTWPSGAGHFTRGGVGDTVDVAYDPIAKRYAMAVKVHALADDGYVPAPKAGRAFRRLIGMSTSEDFLHWDEPWRIHVPDSRDEGLLEFYGMGGMHHRGELRIGLVRVLRDDLPCDAGGPVDGIGYTALATSRDGRTWTRMREPFLDRNPEAGAWDHAMAWGSAVLPVGDDLFIYYGGYARGHKIAPETERQIGLARMRRDRYASLIAKGPGGFVMSRPLRLNADHLTINARTPEDGQVQVTLRTLDGDPIDAFPDVRIDGDHVAAPVPWTNPLRALRGKPVRLVFHLLGKATLYGFDLS